MSCFWFQIYLKNLQKNHPQKTLNIVSKIFQTKYVALSLVSKNVSKRINI